MGGWMVLCLIKEENMEVGGAWSLKRLSFLRPLNAPPPRHLSIPKDTPRVFRGKKEKEEGKTTKKPEKLSYFKGLLTPASFVTAAWGGGGG